MDHTMPALLLLSHGPLCEGMKESAKMVYGNTMFLEALQLKEGVDPEEYKKEVLTVMDRYDNNVFVLVDILGGTPFNVLAQIARERRVYGMAGMSLPMVMEALTFRQACSGQELADAVMENLSACKINLCDFLNNAYHN